MSLAVALRTPWLYGPYIALLAVLPDFQGRGIGSAVLRHVEEDASRTFRNAVGVVRYTARS